MTEKQTTAWPDMLMGSAFGAIAAIWAFVKTDPSVMRLGNDASIVGILASVRAFPADFAGDPIHSHPSTYYFPSHVAGLAHLMVWTGSYARALQVLLFAQILFTLCANAFLLSRICPRLSRVTLAVFAVLVTLPFTLLTSGEMAGFGGLDTALARCTAGIFVPLVLALYWREKSNMVAVAAALGLITNLHAPMGIDVFAVVLAHWLFFRSGWRRWRQALIAVVVFGALAAIFLVPFVAVSGGAAADAHRRPWMSVMWLAKLGFVPVLAALLILSARRSDDESETWPLRIGQLLFVAFLIDVVGTFLDGFISTFPLRRTDRFVFYLLELLIVTDAAWLSVRKLRFVRLLLSIAALLWLATLSMPDTARDLAVRILALKPSTTDSAGYFLQSGIIGLAVCAPLAIAALVALRRNSRPAMSRAMMVYASLLAAVVVFMRVDVAYAAAHAPGVPTAADQLAELEPQIQDAAFWVRSHTPPGTNVLCLGNGFCQQFKFLSRRPGLGDPNEVPIGDAWLKANYARDFEPAPGPSAFIVDPVYSARLPLLMQKYHLRYVFAPMWKDPLFDPSSPFQLLYKNDKFLVYEFKPAKR